MPMPAHATYAGGDGDITFLDVESDRGGAGFTDLVRIDPKGRRLGSIVKCSNAQDEQPTTPCASSAGSFSRSGARFAFAIDGRLAVSAADGTSRVFLDKQTDQDGDPVWTRGDKLVFTGRRGGRSNVYVVDANGAGLRQLTKGGGTAPAYSVTGLVAYAAGGHVHLVKPDGSGHRRLARGTRPDFSPSGRTVVFEWRGRLYSKPVRKGAKARLAARAGGDPVFSPSGKRILYVGPGGEAEALYTVDPKGKLRRKIYDPRTQTAVEVEDISGPAWRPRR